MRLVDAEKLAGEAICLYTYGGARFIPLDALKRAPTVEQPRWVPVTEKLPVASGFCLAALKNGVVSQVCFETQGDHPYFWYRDSLHELTGEQAVTHWMPLPKHPM